MKHLSIPNKLFWLSIVFGTLNFQTGAQTTNPGGRFVLNGTIVGSDTVPLIYLPQVDIESTGSAAVAVKRISYYKLKRDVRTVLPYSRIASAKLIELNEKLPTFAKNRHRRKYLRKEEDMMMEQFEAQLKNLTVTQGRILIKLIYRETGTTTYDLVKDFRGSVNAMLWQGVAHLWGSDLKTEYDVSGEDALMEKVIKEIELEEVQSKK